MKSAVLGSVTFAAVLAATLSGCNGSVNDAFPGYAEGEYIRLAAPFAGNLDTLSVKRGDRVAANAPLFALEQENERAAREEARSRVRRTQSQLENLRKGKRPDEIAVIRAQLAQGEAALALSTVDYQRQEQLVAAKFISPARLDESRTAQQRDRARVVELGAQLRVAQLAGRTDEIAAAAAEVKTAEDQLAQADWKVAQKTQRAPRSALVADTLYAQGEWVPAGMPVVSLLPPENIKVKFYIPEQLLGALKIGQLVQVDCDGCEAPLSAQISFIAPQAEYTAPLIYSKENRATLVFMIEARTTPDTALKLHPGQPVEVRILARADTAKKAL
jgi:HlyD family secretion protein